MPHRRLLLCTVTGALLLTGLSAPSRAETNEVEVSGYQGQSTGGWTCGPRGDLHYGGLGASVRHSQNRPDGAQGRGATILAGAAIEYQRARTTELVTIGDSPETQDFRPVEKIDAQPFAGTHFRAGYHWRHVGVEAGAFLWSGYEHPGSAAIAALPQLEVTLGPRDSFYAVTGFGVPSVTQMLQPAFYFGLGFALSPTARIEASAAQARSGPALSATFAPRFDVNWYVPLRERFSLRAGLSMGGNDAITNREAALGIVFTP